MLGAALCTGAMLAAMKRQGVLAAILFALALTTKQWALVIVGPMLLAVFVYRLPRRKFAAAAVVTGLAVAAPFVLSDPGGYVDAQGRAGSIPVTSWQPASPYSVWYPVTPAKSIRIRPVDGRSVITRAAGAAVRGRGRKEADRDRHAAPDGAADPAASAPLGDRSAAGPRVRTVLRCLLDPFDNPYYHLPFLFAFLAWEALTLRGVPMVASLVSLSFLLQTRMAEVFTSVPAYTVHCVAYLAWSLPLLAFMAVHLYCPALGQRMRGRLTRALPSLSRPRAALAPGSLTARPT